MNYLILFGPPGAGKGTQSQRIIQHFDLLHLATGELLRQQIMNQTELGILAKSFMDKGELVPDGVVIEMLKNKLAGLDNRNGVVFDGFPRTLAQAQALDDLMRSKKHDIPALITLQVPHDELVRRLSSRGLTSGRTDDATVETIENRLKVYHDKTAPVIAHYDKLGKFFPIEGVGPIEEISCKLINTIDEILK